MKFLCIDMEGVLTPEIWHQVRTRAGVAELGLTTRDVKDYRELMDRRVEICARHGVTLEQIQGYIEELEPLPGAKDFLDWARMRMPVAILSDTFREFAGPLMKKLGEPMLLSHSIAYDPGSKRLRYELRQEDAKRKAVESFRALNFQVIGVGDSYNDIPMLKAAHAAVLFRAPDSIAKEFPQFPSLQEYSELKALLG